MDPFDPCRTALLTDMSALAATAAAWGAEQGSGEAPRRATFEVSFRQLPADRGFIVAAGVEQVAQYLLDFKVTPEQLHFVRNLFAFHKVEPEFWDYLAELRFTGDLWSAPEGTPVFPREPVVRITAPLAEAPLFASYVCSSLAHQSTVATKAVRIVEAAAGRDVVDLGSCHAHGPVAGVLGARAAYIAGAAGTTSLEAAHRLGIPIYAPVGRDFLATCADPDEAVRNYVDRFPGSAIVPLDPRDPVADARRLGGLKLPIRSVHLIGSDAASQAAQVRAALDEAGANTVRIMVSGDLDEHRIAALVAANPPIDEIGVGSHLQTSDDAPSLQLQYELVAIGRDGDMVPCALSADGGALAGVKQLFRRFTANRIARGDTLALEGEKTSGAPVLFEVLKDGLQATGRPGLETIREYIQRAVKTLSPELRQWRAAASYEVALSEALTTGQATEATARRARLSEEPTAPRLTEASTETGGTAAVRPG